MTSCLGCNNVAEHPKTLHDGTVVCNSCHAWRNECEARFILGLRDIDERRDWLAKIEARRGKDSADELRATIKALWSTR